MPRFLPALSAVDAAAASVAVDEVRVSGSSVYWLQTVPQEDGRVAIMRLASDGIAQEITGPSTSVGSDLHGYGGGTFAVSGDHVWYVDAASGDIMRASPSGIYVAARRRQHDEHYGDLAVDCCSLWCVRGTRNGDDILRIFLDGTQQVVAASEGFLGAPRPRGDRIAWLRWDADRMPWDGSELWVIDQVRSAVSTPRKVAGGREESVLQPHWDNHDRLWFLSDRSGWWNLHIARGRKVDAVARMASDLCPPPWEAGYQSFITIPDGSVLILAYNGPGHKLILKSRTQVRTVSSPFTSFKPYLSANRGRAFGIGASTTEAPKVFGIDLTDFKLVGLSPQTPEPTRFRSFSQPHSLSISVGASNEVTALLYPPIGAGATWCAPLVVRAHPGPTSGINRRLDWHVQFLTSNGFAVADVDYHGSSGYGRAFRRSLYGHWGELDVRDCGAVATQLLAAGKTRPGQIFITGASAGGYTALSAISQSSVFAGAVARSAIVNPIKWQNSAPRWQRPHAAALSGPAGPIRAEAINRPTLLVHGADDHVAPVSDVVELAQQLTARDIPNRLFILDARHELPSRDAAAQALEAELRFYRDYMDH